MVVYYASEEVDKCCFHLSTTVVWRSQCEPITMETQLGRHTSRLSCQGRL